MKTLPGFRGKVASLSFAMVLGLSAAPARVVINEVQYHPANDDDRLQYIELHNASDAEVDLSKWKLRGAKFDFPNGTKLPAGGYAVVVRDRAAFQRVHGPSPSIAGAFEGKLKRSGERIQLLDAGGQVVDALTYSDDAPWPMGADGEGSTLERICPAAPGDDPHNWASSKRPERKGWEGTPGAINSAFAAVPLPVVNAVKFARISQPGTPLPVSATITGRSEIQSAVLQYQVFRPNRPGTTNEIELSRSSGSGAKDRYEAAIPGQPEGTLIRFVIRATEANGAERIFPSPHEPRPALSIYIGTEPERARIPNITILNTSRPGRAAPRMGSARQESVETGSSAFIYVPPNSETGGMELFDFVEVRHRKGGWKVHFPKDQLLQEMSAINIISEGPHRWMLAEHLAYELYRRVGMKIQESGHLRLNMDGRALGHYLWVEQPNKAFLARSGRDKDGNFYKILWYEQDLVRAHEKKTNPHSGHDDVVGLVKELSQRRDNDQWAYIQEQFNVTNVIDYFAVNMCIQNWDGFFNNYFAYHDLKKNGKWEIIPWDEDKTWGEYDGASGKYDWYEMPLTMGMAGDRPTRAFFGGGPFGGAGWWRPGGYFSRPLLANVEFRKRFLDRLQEICQTVFTEEYFYPAIQSVFMKLEPEVVLEARARGQDPKHALREFEREIETFRKQVSHRRKFILEELQKR